MSDHECIENDPHMIFLELAEARAMLVRSCLMTPEEAIAGLIEPFREVAHGAFCHCECEMMARMFRDQPKVAQVAPPRRRAAA
jgi:hypothetical protein